MNSETTSEYNIALIASGTSISDKFIVCNCICQRKYTLIVFNLRYPFFRINVCITPFRPDDNRAFLRVASSACSYWCSSEYTTTVKVWQTNFCHMQNNVMSGKMFKTMKGKGICLIDKYYFLMLVHSQILHAAFRM